MSRRRSGIIPGRPQGYGDPIAAYCTGRARHVAMIELADRMDKARMFGRSDVTPKHFAGLGVAPTTEWVRSRVRTPNMMDMTSSVRP